MSENGMTYFLYGGALIGSYRHHGLVPWDDDVDVIMPFSHRLNLYRLLGSLHEDIIVSFHPVHYWKLYHKDGEVIRNVPWKYPFLDIFFYNKNETHIWDMAPQYKRSFVYPKYQIFPLRLRPFMGLSMFVPKDPKAVISKHYNISMCTSGGYAHRWERKIYSTTVPCSWMQPLFPFVERQTMHGGCNETLWYRDTLVGDFFDWGVSC
ncbi:hypothetical protein EGW08_015762 [Elysia chlorotica]|uniref:LicD/FKTN/FKRP nucleotidyltransferase domain-containing protein n=1 Tax=Elysia chlorotica TaxID=188477 RepID=A0A3S1BB52_ELYCH|nr:hypothetical protein EGW08_015762 [Elysia chlorotica]